tara:strand:- start:661 stop:1155 length:495 start_codon:yes stop_codon:yes gene_type:complete
MIYDEIQFPIYVVGTEDVDLIDGLLVADGQVIDDKNMPGNNLAMRRLQTPMKSIYPLRFMIDTIPDLIRHRGKSYVDSNGQYFLLEKTKTASIKYHKIGKLEGKGNAALVWCLKSDGIDIPFPFVCKRPPKLEETWAGILYRNGLPWELWEFATEKKRDTWRKI